MRLEPSESAFLAFCLLFRTFLFIILFLALFYLIGIWTIILAAVFLVTWGLVHYLGNKDWEKVKYNWENKK